MIEYLKIEKEKVLAAAKECLDWEKGLKKLFPMAFEERKIDLPRLLQTFKPCTNQHCIHNGKGINLSMGYNWKLETNETGEWHLIPSRKKP
jgi:hypothetical protein